MTELDWVGSSDNLNFSGGWGSIVSGRSQEARGGKANKVAAVKVLLYIYRKLWVLDYQYDQ